MEGPLEQTGAKCSWIFVPIRISNELIKNNFNMQGWSDSWIRSISFNNICPIFRLDNTDLYLAPDAC